jgi:hypothetical protein
MNAVNLIPGDSRRRRANVSTSRQTLALFGGLVAVLVAAVLYVLAANDVTTRTSELAQVTATADRWQTAANAYAAYSAEASQRTQQMTAVTQLAASRFEWSGLLDQISGLMPADAALTSLSATTADTSATGTTATGTAATAATTTAPLPSVQLVGCAATQSAVAQAMVQLHKVQDVSAVTLSSSVDGGNGGAAASSAGSSGASTGGCPFPVQFQVALTFTAPSTSATSAATSATAGAVTSTSAATPVTASGTTTAAAQ